MKPILFNTEMVKAILDGRKTQTRRVINLKNNDLIFTGFIMSSTAKGREGCCSFGLNKERDLEYIKPKYKVGDFLWAREPVRVETWCGRTNKIRYWYQASREDEREIDLPKRFEDIFSGGNRTVIPDWITECKGVPNGCIKEMARIFLKVTNVRVERLNKISIIDIIKEGCPENYFDWKIGTKEQTRDWWINLWNSTAKDGYKWEDNPYVFVYEFERVTKES